MKLTLIVLSRLADQWAPVECLHPTVLRLQTHTQTCQAFPQVPGSKLTSACFAGKHITDWGISRKLKPVLHSISYFGFCFKCAPVLKGWPGLVSFMRLSSTFRMWALQPEVMLLQCCLNGIIAAPPWLSLYCAAFVRPTAFIFHVLLSWCWNSSVWH